MTSRLKVGFISLGCPKNLVDTEVMLGLAAREGLEIVSRAEEAEVVVINTCCFISQAEDESDSTIREFQELKKKKKIKRLIVSGCLPQRYKEKLLARYPLVDHFIGSSDFREIVRYVGGAGERLAVGRPDYIYDSLSPRVNSQGGWTSYVKISEGCSEACTFCIVPKLRGKLRSRKIPDIEEEVISLAESGVKEINLIAQNLTSYGKDLKQAFALESLLGRLAAIKGVKWLRLLYNYPKGFSDALVETVAATDKICKYVDLPLQHIDDRILKSMGRKSDSTSIMKLLDKLRDKIPGLVLRTSFIVGFPGETEREFNGLMDFVKKYRFEKIAIFPYSPEKGTASYRLGDTVPEKVKLDRYDRLMELKKEVALSRNREFLGGVYEVLIEKVALKENSTQARGRFYGQAPEVDGEVVIKTKDKVSPGEFRRVTFEKADPYDFFGSLHRGHGTESM